MKLVPMIGKAEIVDEYGPIEFVAFHEHPALEAITFYPNGKSLRGRLIAVFGTDVNAAWKSAEAFLDLEEFV